MNIRAELANNRFRCQPRNVDKRPPENDALKARLNEVEEELASLRAEVTADGSNQLPVRVSKDTDVGFGGSIENRIAAAPTAEVAAKWAQIRGELKRQDELSADREAVRSGQLIALRAKIGLSFLGVGAGAGLLIAGLPAAVGLFCIGVGLSPVAPELVATTFKQIFGKTNDE